VVASRRLPNTFVDIHNDIVALLVEVCLKSVILLPCQIAFYEHQSDTKNKNLHVYIFQSAAKKSDLMLLLKAGKKNYQYGFYAHFIATNITEIQIFLKVS